MWIFHRKQAAPAAFKVGAQILAPTRLLAMAEPARTGNSCGGVGAAPARVRISGFAIVTKVTKAATGLPGQPDEWDGADLAQRHRLSRFDRQNPEMQIPQLLDRVPNVVLLAGGHPSEVTIKSWPIVAWASVSVNTGARSG